MERRETPALPQADCGALYENAACGLLVTSADGIILRVNHTFCTWVGREAVELAGRVKVQDDAQHGRAHLSPDALDAFARDAGLGCRGQARCAAS
jgi:PAS domain-containing protein